MLAKRGVNLLWSLVGSKQNAQWLWLGLGIGVLRQLPKAGRNQAKFYTDFWQAHTEIIPQNNTEEFPRAVGKLLI